LKCLAHLHIGSSKTDRSLDNYAYVLFPPAVQLMPNIQVKCATRCQGHMSFWRAARASGIVKETF
jgi:hypothetical protein